MERITRFIAAASLVALLAACGGEGGRDREEGEGPADREKPSLGAPQDEEDGKDKKEEKEEKQSRGDADGDADD